MDPEHTVSVRDTLRKLQPNAAQAQLGVPKADETSDNSFVRIGSVRQKMAQLNGASQDWRTRVRTENDAVQFTSEFKMRSRSERTTPLDSSSASASVSASTRDSLTQDSPPKLQPPTLDHSTSCTEQPALRVHVEREPSESATNSVFADDPEPVAQIVVANVPAAPQNEQRQESVAEYRLRMRPKRAHASARAQKSATVCDPETIAEETYAPATMNVSKQESLANLSVEVQQSNQVTERGDVLLNRADRAVKTALSTKLDLEQETARWKRSNDSKQDENENASLFGAACPLHSDKDWCALLVKGKRKVQVRLIASDTSKFNGGDSYVIVTRANVFVLYGSCSSVLKRARASDVAKLVATRRELGYCNADELNAIAFEQQELLSSEAEVFWTAVSQQAHLLAEPLDDDEQFETACFSETCVIEVEKQTDSNGKTQLRLRPLFGGQDSNSSETVQRASQLSSALLDSQKALILQFGNAEVYLWFGKYFDFRLRNAALQLAVSYVHECLPDRPAFSLLAKVNEGAEPTLFVQKFSEWLRRDGSASSIPVQRAQSERSRDARVARRSGSDVADKRGEPPKLRLDDALLARLAHSRLSAPSPDCSFVLNNDELRRGAQWTEIEDEGVIRRLHDVTTLSVSQWLVDAKNMQLTMLRNVATAQQDADALPSNGDASLSNRCTFHLFEQNSYVLRWVFKLDGRIITQRGGLCWPHGEMLQTGHSREPRSRHSSTTSASSAEGDSSGRVCSAHFLWHGAASSSQMRTAAAYLLCALDSDKTPHRVVEQFREPPAFLRLLNSARPHTVTAHDCPIVLFEHRGFHGNQTSPSASLFVLRHDYPDERVFVHMDCSVELLHANACYLFISDAAIHYWDARDSPVDAAQREELGQFVKSSAEALHNERPKELFGDAFTQSLTVQKADSWLQFVSLVCSSVCQPLTDTLLYNPQCRLRLFRFVFSGSTAPEFDSLNFDLLEMHAPLRREQYTEVQREPRFPFTQSDLVDLNCQTDSVLLLDAYQRTVFVWFARDSLSSSDIDADQDTESSHSVGSLANEHLRVAVQTALAYCDQLASLSGSKPDGHLVFSGLEPALFRRLFPFWTPSSAARKASNAMLGRAYDSQDSYALALHDAHHSLFNRHHSVLHLRERAHVQAPHVDVGVGLPLRISVESRHLEAYVSDAEFETAFKMTREQFYALPRWRQTALKKELSLL